MGTSLDSKNPWEGWWESCRCTGRWWGRRSWASAYSTWLYPGIWFPNSRGSKGPIKNGGSFVSAKFASMDTTALRLPLRRGCLLDDEVWIAWTFMPTFAFLWETITLRVDRRANIQDFYHSIDLSRVKEFQTIDSSSLRKIVIRCWKAKWSSFSHFFLFLFKSSSCSTRTLLSCHEILLSIVSTSLCANIYSSAGALKPRRLVQFHTGGR